MHKDLVRAFERTTINEKGCWIFEGCKARGGYGLKQIDGKLQLLHRAAYERLVGPLPEGAVLRHRCPGGDEPACWNPEHLKPGTQQQNLMESDTAAARQAAQTHCKRGHEFTPENTYLYRGMRNCKACRVVTSRDSKRKRREGLPDGRKILKTHCAHGHEFTEANTLVNKDGSRACRECHRTRAHARYQKLKSA
jgi:hypothetical protein